MITSSERLTAAEFRDIEHALQVLTALDSHARSREVAPEQMSEECTRAENTLRRLLGFRE